MKNKKIIIIVAIVLVFIIVQRIRFLASGEQSAVDQLPEEETAYEAPEEELKLAHGELLSVTENGSTVVVKAKIEPNLTDKMTIAQNYYSVSALIRNDGFDKYDEIQYWAVADIAGDEMKVISFTLDKTAIDGVHDGNIVDSELGDYATDLWIAPALEDGK